MATKQKAPALENMRPFGMRDQMGYLAGNFAGDFTYTLCTGFMMKFYTDVLGVSAGIVGLAMMIAQVLDAVTDLGMGQICDRAPTTKDGKFRPWIRRIAGPVSLISFLMYASWIKGAAMPVKIAWLFVTYLLYSSVFYTMIIIPYGSMASAMSNDALVTDIVDDEEVRTGKRMDGTIYSVYSFGRKFGSALSSGVTGMMLSIIGYTEANMYEPAITNGIYNISCIVPMIGFALMALIAGVLYPLNKKRVDSNVAILKQKHGGQ